MAPSLRPRRALLSLLLGLIALALIAAAAGAKSKPAPKPRPGYFPASCNTVSLDRAIRSFQKGDAWRFSKPYAFPFTGWTDRGISPVIWKHVTGNTIRKASYPAPNLPSCRVGHYGTEDRASHKAGKYFESLEPIDGSMTYEFKDTFDRHIATLSWTETPPVPYHPSKWGWFIDGKWAGHDATRAFEAQTNACKFIAQPVTTTDANGQPVTSWQWVRDPNAVMVAFNPGLGSPGKGYAPHGSKSLRVRAFLDKRALPPAELAEANKFDFGCGATALPPRIPTQTLSAYYFDSSFGPNKSYLRGYYFGEGPTTIDDLPGEARRYNSYPLNNYNPRPQYSHATYVMVNTTGVAGGGMVRGIVQSTVDRFTMYDEMRYCDPNYTLRNMQVKKGKKHYKKSLYFAPYSFSALNRPSVRWMFGRFDPNPSTLTGEQALAAHNPLSPQMFGWIPIYCDR